MQAKRWMCACLLLSLLTTVAFGQAAAPPTPAPAAVAPADPTALLKAIPANASGFVAIGNLKQFDTHVQGVLQQLQLQGLVPPPLEWLKTQTGLTKGLNENAGAAFVVLSTAEIKTPEQIAQRMILLLPTNQPDELMTALGGQKEGDVTRITLMGQASVAAPKDGFLVVAEKPETLKEAVAARDGGVAKNLSPERIKELAGQDVFAWASPSALSPDLRQQISQAINGALSSMTPPGASQPAVNPAEQLTKLIDETAEVSLGLTLDQRRGLTAVWYMRAKPGTEIAAQMAATQAKAGSLLTGLPNQPFIFALGAAGAGGNPAAKRAVDQSLTQVMSMYENLAKTAGVNLEGKLQPLKDPLVELTTNVDQMAVAFSELPAETPDGRIALTVVAQVKDNKNWVKVAHRFFDQIKALIVDVAKQQPGEQAKIDQVLAAIQWKDNAEQVDGATVDHFVVDLDKIPGAAEDKEGLTKVKNILGQEGVLLRIAAIGDKDVSITFGGGAKRFKDVLAAAQKHSTALEDNPSIKKLAARLPAGPRYAEMYLDLENLFKLISDIAAQTGGGMPFPLTLRNAAPVAMVGVKAGEAAQQATIVVPMELISSVREMLGPMLGMMMGGMGTAPGAPGSAPAPAPEVK